MVTGDSPLLTIIVWVPTALLVLIGETWARGILTHLSRPWRIALYLLAAEAAILIGATLTITIYTLVRHP
jgi:hypothetical protein